jgi:8-oxo-dGTP diphosphatase
LKNERKNPIYQVTAGVIRKNGKLLISKRRKGAHLEGVWEFPGGKQEKGESLSECLERELFEELGISVRVGSRIASVDYEYPQKRIVLHGFYCTWKKGEPKPLQCQAIRWVSPGELPDLALPPPDMKILKTVINSKFFGEWMKGKDMFYKKNSDGYNTPVKGIKLKSLTYGEKTHMCEFVLDAGSAIPEHSHPHEQTGYLVSGKIDFLMEGKTFDAEPGDSWSIPGDMPHSANVIEDSVIVEVFSPVREEYL